MLKRFLYLDDAAVTDYLSALEGGIRDSLQTKKVTGRSSEGGLDAKVLKAGLGRSHADEELLTLSDSPQARFERLLKLAKADPETAAWVEVLNPETDLADAGTGAMIDVECEIYVPDIIKALSSSGGITQALDALEALLPAAETFGFDTTGLPSKKEREGVKKFAAVLGGNLVAVGELDESVWRLAGQLKAEFVNGDIEGRARMIGKISTRWAKGVWKPMLALPGSSLLPRAERRALEWKRPEEDDEQNYLEGPAIMLDILAIYR